MIRKKVIEFEEEIIISKIRLISNPTETTPKMTIDFLLLSEQSYRRITWIKSGTFSEMICSIIVRAGDLMMYNDNIEVAIDFKTVS